MIETFGMSVRARLGMRVAERCAGLALVAILLGAAAPAPPNPPLYLYDPNGGTGTAQTATLSLGTAAPGAAAANCGSLTNPCGNLGSSLDPKSLAILNDPLGHDVHYGVNGSVTAGVSNHGNVVGGSVTAWLEKGDTTLSLTVSAAQLSGGPRYYVVPVPRP